MASLPIVTLGLWQHSFIFSIIILKNTNIAFNCFLIFLKPAAKPNVVHEILKKQNDRCSPFKAIYLKDVDVENESIRR